MASTKLTAKARAAFSVLAFVACDLARTGLEPDQQRLALFCPVA